MSRLPAVVLAIGAAAALTAVALYPKDDGVRVQAPAALTSSAVGNPTVAMNPRTGDALVAYVGGEHGRPDVYLAAQRADGSLGGAVRVNDRPGDVAPHEQAPAQVAVGPEGNVYVVWQNNRDVPGRRFPASDLRFARSTDGGKTFDRAVTVNDDAGGLPSSHTFHDVAVAPDGTLYVSWLDSRVRDSVAAARPHPTAPGGNASPANVSVDGHGGAANGAAGAHPSAESHGATEGHGGGMGHGERSAHGAGGAHGGHGGDDPTLPGSEIRVARSTDGGKTFEASRVVDAGVCPCCRTSLAIGADGAVYVAWRKVYAGDVRDVVVARRGPGDASFGPPVRVHADGWVYPGCPHAGPSLAVDGRGRLHVGWYTGKEGRQGLWHAVSADGGRTFGDAEPVLTGGWVPPVQVRLAPTATGVTLAWDDRRERTPHLSLARASDGAGVKPITPRVDGKTPSLASAALADGRRVTVAAWLDGTTVRVRRITAPGS
jgi:hypothetical protein